MCLGENEGTDDSCTYTGGPGGLSECNDTVDNADPEDTLADAADPSCHTSCDATQSDYVPTFKENRFCKKPIYRNF